VERRGQVIAVELGPIGSYPGGARRFSGRRQPSHGDTSRMNREVQVRICEGLGVKLPGPTRQNEPSKHVRIGDSFNRKQPLQPFQMQVRVM
jgi:hypothetical protein